MFLQILEEQKGRISNNWIFFLKKITFFQPNRATSIAEKLRVDFCLVHRDRSRNRNETIVVGDVDGKVAIIIDDVVDTGNTICHAAEVTFFFFLPKFHF